MKYSVTCILLALATGVPAQVLENIRAEIVDGTVFVTYDLTGPPTGIRVDVRLFSSHDSFSKALTGTSGDMGRVRPGLNKRITWQPGATMTNYHGALSFELQGEIIKDWEFLPSESNSIRRGKPAAIRWQGGLPSDNVRVELKHEEEAPVWNIAMVNKNAVEWILPKKGDCGKGYAYRLTAEDGTYRLRHKAARISVFMPFIALCGAAAFFYADNYLPLPTRPLLQTQTEFMAALRRIILSLCVVLILAHVALALAQSTSGILAQLLRCYS